MTQVTKNMLTPSPPKSEKMGYEFGKMIRPDDTDYDTEDRPISAAWAIVPTALRPGKGARPLRAGFSPSDYVRSGRDSLSKLTWTDVLEAGKEPVRCLPAVILGLLLNVLDGVSYGLIIFPNSYPIFSDFGGDGVSMFFVTCVISQLVYSLGGSIFRGGNVSAAEALLSCVADACCRHR
jgi:SulP family sulfate permease